MRSREEIHVHVHLDDHTGRIISFLQDIDAKLDALYATQGEVMSDLSTVLAEVDQLEADVAADTALDTSAATAIDRLIELYQSNASDPAAITAITERLRAVREAGGPSNTTLGEAVLRGTAADPNNAPPAEPPTDTGEPPAATGEPPFSG